MVVRHRVPTVFTLYMVDVLCCALGCVILLWFLKLHEAQGRERAAEQTSAQLAEERTKLEQSTGDLAGARKRLAAAEEQGRQTAARLAAAEKDRDQARKEWEAAAARAGALEKDLGEARSRVDELGKELAVAAERQGTTEKELAAARERSAGLETKLKERDTEATAAARTADDLSRRLKEAEGRVKEKEGMIASAARSADDLAERLREKDARVKELQGQADQVGALRGTAQAALDKLAAQQTRLDALEKELGERKKELAAAGQTVLTLQSENRGLSAQMSQVKAAAENRFAGITLAGRRVVFLVDMSGSMELVDEQTAAPEKWVAVRETLAKVMRSLPELEKFQVILFSTGVTYPLDREGQWQDYDPKTSLDRVMQALAATRPKGNTNMYSAFQEAFRYRPQGMDTIYLLSDGLPNVGPGLDVVAAQSMTEPQREELLSKYIRRVLQGSWNRAGGNQPRVKINTIGFFYESPDVGAFLWALARENDGSFVGMSRP